MKNLILTLIITLPITLLGQGWEQTYDGTDNDIGRYGRSVKQTTDSGYIITGESVFSDVFILKTDGNGIEQWSKTFGGTEIDKGFSIQQTTDGGYIITGETWSYGNGQSDVYLIKTDSQGDSLWTKTFGGTESDGGISVQQTTDGGYIITGRTWSYENGGNYDIYLIKTDEYGEEQWTKTFGGISSDQSNTVQQCSDGGYIISGGTSSFGNGGDVYLIKTDVNGDEQWSQTFGGTGNDSNWSLDITSDGGFILSGFSNYDEVDLTLVKIDEYGNELWSQTYGDEGIEDVGISVQQTIDGGYIISGYKNNYIEINMLLVKFDENGNELWSQIFENGSFGYSVQQTTDGGYIISGQSNNNSVFLVKTDGYGNILPYESTISGCDSIESLVDETFFYESGEYIDSLTNIYGGDSIIIQNVEIYSSPEIVQINGNVTVFNSSLEFYQLTTDTDNLLEWNITGGSIYENQNNIIQVLWGNEGIGYVKVTETDTNGCSTTSTLEVTISNESTNINDYNKNRKLIKTINLLGQEIIPKTNQPFIEIYDDGTRNRKIIIE